MPVNPCHTYTIIRKINKLIGRVEFDYVFASTPDVWLRNTSSGTDVSPIAGLQNYEPFEKNIKVLSVDKYGFTFEMEYWKVKGYTSAGQHIESYDIPDIDNGSIHIDYTAVGDETSTPKPAPISVVVSGPTSLSVNEVGNWSASVTGGVSPYSYEWYKTPNMGSPILVSTSSSYSGSSDTRFSLSVKVTDSRAEEGHGGLSVTVIGDCGGGIGICKEVNNEEQFLPNELSISNNYPNPFNPTTQISVALPEASDVTVKVYNLMGQQVATLVNNTMSAGFHEVTFDAGNLSSGLYIAKINAIGNSGESFTKEIKMQLVK